MVDSVPSSGVPSGRIIFRRFVARFIDCVIIGSGATIIAVFAGSNLLGLLFGALVELIKDIGFHGYRSPGKTLMGLVLTDAETGTREVQPWQRVARNALGPCTLSLVGRLGLAATGLAIVLGMVNDGWAIFSTRRQTLMDEVSGVVVFHE